MAEDVLDSVVSKLDFSDDRPMDFSGPELDSLEKELKLETLDATEVKSEPGGEVSNSISTVSNQLMVKDKKINMSPIVLLDKISKEMLSRYTHPPNDGKGKSQRIRSKVAAMNRPQNRPQNADNKTTIAANSVPTKQKAKKPHRELEFQATKVVIKPKAKKPKKLHPCNCPECGKLFKSRSSMCTHKYVVHSGIKPYVCQECQKAFSWIDKLRRHLLVHTGEMPFTCGVCHKRFRDLHNMRRHESDHWRPFRNTKMGRKRRAVVPIHRCDLCCREFKRPYLLKVHLRLHTGERPYKCQDCDKCFRMLTGLKHHLLVAHVQPLGLYLWQCGMCDTRFHKMESLQLHLSSHHSGEAKFMCRTCGKTFSALNALSEHLPEHTPVKSFRCEQCGAGFPSKWKLRRHAVIHQSSTEALLESRRRHREMKRQNVKHICDVCGKSFLKRCTLNEHMCRHTGIRPHLCSQCGASFLRPFQLNSHMLRRHNPDATPPPPSGSTGPNVENTGVHVDLNGYGYTCGTCGKWFHMKSRLKVHMPLHTTAKPFVCKLCNLRYKRRRDLLTHTKFRCKFRKEPPPVSTGAG